MTSDVVLRLVGITKRFPHVTALENVDFELRRGEIHALLGENGAGKTTLVNIVYGIYQPDSGIIELEGKPVIIDSPKTARRLGIVMLSQHPVLIESMTVLENLALWLRERPSKKLRKFIEERLSTAGIELDLDAKIWQLPPVDKAKVELAKILLVDAKVYILDEPTSLIGLKDRAVVYRVVRKLKSEGRSIIYITHRIDEVFEIADRVTVLRKGRRVLTKLVSEVSREELLEAMFGHRVEERVNMAQSSSTTEPLLELRNITIRDDLGRLVVRNLNLTVHRGEIVGITGPPRQSKREILEVIAGLRKPEQGQVILQGQDITKLDPGAIRRLGVAYIPDDRLGLAVAPSLEVVHNVLMRDLDLYTTKTGMFVPEYRSRALQLLSRVGLPERVLDVPCADLSGGMIQRVVLARELLARQVQLVLAANPTYGLDLETATLVHEMLLELKQRGCGILLMSEDVRELDKLCDRVVVIADGEVKQVLTRSELRREVLEQLLVS